MLYKVHSIVNDYAIMDAQGTKYSTGYSERLAISFWLVHGKILSFA